MWMALATASCIVAFYVFNSSLAVLTGCAYAMAFQSFEIEHQTTEPVHMVAVLGLLAVLILFDWANTRPPVAADGERVLFFERQKLKLCAVHALNNMVPTPPPPP